MIGIYKITNPKNKIYIGQSINIQRRLNKYKRYGCSRQPIIYRSLIKYGVDNHIFEVIEECDIHKLNERERYWQDFYNSVNNGLNCVLTNTIYDKKIYGIETKIKMSNSHKGKKLSELTRNRISASGIGRKLSDETKKNMSKSRIGIKFSENHIKNITESKKNNSNRCKLILNLENGVFHIGVKEAAKTYSMSEHTLKFRLNGKYPNNTNLIYI